MSHSSPRILLGAACAACLAVLPACQRPPVEWDDATVTLDVPGDGARLVAPAAATPALSVAPSAQAPPPPGACPGSARTARAGSLVVSAFWRAAQGGAATLYFRASRDAGATWTPEVVVDARDRGGRGCDRPPPAIAIGQRSDYVHLAYWLEPADGAGVFFAHSMDGGRMFHSPVAVVYGTGAARAAVASVGDTVVVASEDPNAPAQRLLLAISRTAGHIFELRTNVPSEGAPQPSPQVALRGRDIYVGWRDARGASLVVRRGRLGDPD